MAKLSPISTTRFPGRARCLHRNWRWPVLFLLLALQLPADPVDPVGDAPITTAREFWALPPEARTTRHAFCFEGRVNFYDPTWRLLWMENAGEGFFLAPSGPLPALRSGQRVRLEGTMVPAVGLQAETTRITVLEASTPGAPLATHERIGDLRTFDRRLVTVEAYVDEQQLIDAEHVRLWLIVEGRSVIGWVPPPQPYNPTQWQGRYVRLEALYSGRLDPTGNETSIELWAASPSAITDLGDISRVAPFDLPLVPINEINRYAVGTPVHIRGCIQQRETGVSVIVRDLTGEVQLRSLQRSRLPLGTEVEAVGQVALVGTRWVLQAGLFRPTTPPEHPAPASPSPEATQAIETIRQLTPEEAARGQPVTVAGVVTWAMPDADFFFLQDLSGGVRVRYPRNRMAAPDLQKQLRIAAVTYADPQGPALELRNATDLGSQSTPQPRRVGYDRALSGSVNGQWVEMRGFVQRIVSEGNWRWIHVTTPTGEFLGHLHSPAEFVAPPGALLRLHGVCENTFDQHGQAAGVILRIPYLHDILIEEDAPADPFELPRRPLASLRQIRAQRDLARVRIGGVVLHQRAGEVVVQEGTIGLSILTTQTTPLAPGDTIEAVGILGNDGARLLLREAVFRRLGAGPPPTWVEVSTPAVIRADLDRRVVRLRGQLLDTLHTADQVRYTLQSGNTLFEARLETPVPSPSLPDFALGTGLELTGLYRVDFDDTQHPRSFQIHLRRPEDVAVYQRARLWTLSRALLACGLLAGLILLVLAWVVTLRRQVQAQTEQSQRQLEKQAALEAELERSQRLRSLGLLAGGIAHDFNNLLTGIMGNLSLAMYDAQAVALIGDYLQEAEKCAHRARDITQQLATFAQGGALTCVVSDLTALVDHSILTVLGETKVHADFSPPADLWWINADRDQLARALQGLLTYTRSTLPQGGVVRLAADNATVPDHGPLPLAAGRYVRLTLTNPGASHVPEKLDDFFDPYATTKFGDARFGLAITYASIKRHGGHIEVEFTPHRGLVFQVWLPAALPGAPLAPGVLSEPALPQPLRHFAGLRVLLMDDEGSIRRLGSRLLQYLGCATQVAENGEECVEIYQAARQSAAPFQLVILDLTVISGMGAQATLAALRQIDPHVRAIISSGYGKDPAMVDFAAHGFVQAVAKPYEAATLALALQQALEATPGAGQD